MTPFLLRRLLGSCGVVLSSKVWCTIVLAQPYVTPATTPVSGGEATLTVAGFAGTPALQWWYRGTPIVGATQSTLVIPQVTRGHGGPYDVQIDGGAFATGYRLDVAPTQYPDFYAADVAAAPQFEREGGGWIRTVVPLADGKFLVGGDFTRLADQPLRYLARVNSDGTPDPSYLPPVLNGPVHALLGHSDGRVYVGGEFTTADGRPAGRLLRLKASGARDEAFDLGAGFDGAVLALAEGRDGKLLVGGEFLTIRGTSSPRFLRLDSSGALVPDNRKGSILEPVRVIAISKAGLVMIGGGHFFPVTASASPSPFLIRLDATGEFDATWTRELQVLPGPPAALLELPDGRWLVGCESRHGNVNTTDHIRRLRTDGQYDESFALPAGLRNVIRSVTTLVRTNDDRLLIAGTGVPPRLLTGNGSEAAGLPVAPFTDASVATHTREADGSSRFWGVFQSDGPRTGNTVLSGDRAAFSPVGGVVCRGEARVYHAENVPGGGVWVRGDFTHVNGVARRGLALLRADGSVNPGFDPGGLVPLGATGKFVRQGDGKVLVHDGTGVIRLMPDGRRDTGFARFDFPAGALAIQRDGAVLVANGATGGPFGTGYGARRLSAAGELVAGFAPSANARIVDLGLFANGHVLLAGSYGTFDSGVSYSTVRVTPAGVRDSGFTLSGGPVQKLEAMVGDSFYVRSSEGGRDQLVRVNTLGRDLSFELQLLPYGETAMLSLPNSRLMLSVPPTVIFSLPTDVIRRILANGSVDSRFKVDGLDVGRSEVSSLVLMDDGSLLVFGRGLSAYGAPRLGSVRLIRATAPAITREPGTVVAAPGGAATLSVGVSGTEPLTYQWYRDGMKLPGATGATLMLNDLTVADVGRYVVRVGNTFGNVVSAVGRITGSNPAPVVSAVSGPAVTTAGTRVEYSVSASGTGPLRYQWRKFGTRLAGATNATLTLDRVEMADTGIYDVEVADGMSVTVSEAARLMVAPRRQPESLMLDESFRLALEKPGGAISAILPLADGKFIVSGAFTRFNGVPATGLVRVNAALEVDGAFQAPAILNRIGAHTVGRLAWVTVHAVQPDGKLLVTRPRPQIPENPARNELVRLTPDGAEDPSFVMSSLVQNVEKVALQPDGRIIVLALRLSVGPAPRYAYRLEANGSLDTSYAPIFADSSAQYAPEWVVVQPDGRAVFGGGAFSKVNGTTVASRPVRLSISGQLDTSFAFSGVTGNVAAAVLLPDGGLLVAGSFALPNGSSANLGRLTADGAWDRSWSLGNSVTMNSWQIQRGADGNVWVSGFSDSVRKVLRFWRFSAAGALEAEGTSATDSNVWSVAPGSGGQAFATVTHLASDVAEGIVIRRLRANGAVEGVVGRTETESGVTAVVAAPGGKLYATGSFVRVSGVRRGRIVRLNRDGSLDAAFDSGSGFDAAPSNLAVLADGRVLVQGPFSSYRGESVKSVVRLFPDGRRDVTFAGESNNPIGPLQLMRDGRVLSGLARPLLADGTADPDYQVGNGNDSGPTAPTVQGGTMVLVRQDSWYRVMEFRSDGTLFKTGGNVDLRMATALVPTYDGAWAAGGAASVVIGTRGADRPRVIWLNSNLGAAATASYLFPRSDNSLYAFTGPKLLPLENRRVILSDYFGLLRAADDGTFTHVGPADMTLGDDSVRPPNVCLQLEDGSLLWGDEKVSVSGLRRSGLVRVVDALAPRFIAEPGDPTIPSGAAATLAVTVAGPGPMDFQWWKDGVPIEGATGAALEIREAGAADAGLYSVVATNASAGVRSGTFKVSVRPIERGLLSSLAQTAGPVPPPAGAFVVESHQSKAFLIRAVGPGLAPLGVAGPMANPSLTVRDARTGAAVATNDDWSAQSNSTEVAAAAARAGAYPLQTDSRDAAIFTTFAPGAYRVEVASAGGAGAVSLEIYEGDATPRLVYLATLAAIGSGGQLTQAVALGAPVAERSYLVRALGEATGRSGALADPRVSIHAGTTPIAANDDWAGDAAAVALALTARAMPLRPGSRDAAVHFRPTAAGVHTFQVSGNGGAGVVLLEVFEIDPGRRDIPAATVVRPESVTAQAGQRAVFGVVTTGDGAPSFQWSRNGQEIPGATAASLVVPHVQTGDGGRYTLAISSRGVVRVEETALAVLPVNNALQRLATVRPRPGGMATVTNEVHYIGLPAPVSWTVTLPADWSLVSDSGHAELASLRPAAGATGALRWEWTTPPASPVRFTYSVRLPDAENQGRTLTAAVQAGATAVTVSPEALTLAAPVYAHTADLNADLQLDLSELTRVIELFNTRRQTTRTGAYAVVGSESADGFLADPFREPGGPLALSDYHSADTDRDGRIGVFELTRVIQLYNQREGTRRVGRYRAQAGTEDGFAPAGP